MDMPLRPSWIANQIKGLHALSCKLLPRGRGCRIGRPGKISRLPDQLQPNETRRQPMSCCSRLTADVVRSAACAIGLALFVAFSGGPAAGEGPGPFAGLDGAWAGTGTIRMASGANERIRCRVSYAVQQSGSALQQELRCASDSYKFELSSNIRSQAGSLTGQWSELTRNAGGTVSGRAIGGDITGLVESSGFSADLSVATQGNRQSVLIRPRGIDVAEVTITLRRATR